MTAAGEIESPLEGTAKLVRFMLRRDRLKLPVWILAMSLTLLYYTAALPTLLEGEEKLKDFAAAFTTGPVTALIGGPGYGFDDLTFPRFVVGVYGLYFLLAVGLMNILLIARHTRVEEQSGRLELLRAQVVGRHAPLTAALVVALLANLALSVVMGLTAIAGGYAMAGSMLFGASIGALGLAFAGISAVTAQLSEFSRSGSGMAGAILGAAWVIRAAGDMIAEHGSPLSWVSPIAWSQQTRAFVNERWWPLGFSVLLFLACAAFAFRLSDQRDLGAGIRAPKRGSATAARWISSPLRFAFRLQRGAIIGWGTALAAAAIIYGAITKPLADAFADMGELYRDIFSLPHGQVASEVMIDSYMGMMALTDAIVVAIFGILALLSFRSHEEDGLTESILATPTSRFTWLGGQLLVTAVGGAVVLTLTGFFLGAASSIGIGDSSIIWDVTWAHFVRVPEFLVVLGLGAFLYGWTPRFLGIAWVILTFGGLIAFFGPLMDLPQWLYNLGVFDHIPRVPHETFTITPGAALSALALAAAGVGLWGFARRDIESN